MSTNHPTTTISHEGMTAEVDEMIAPLILNLWRLGINTDLSCQDNVPDKWVWIMFSSANDAEYFLAIAAKEFNSDPESLYNRIRQQWECNSECWKYSAHPRDLNVDCFETGDNSIDEEPYEDSSPEFLFSISVRFPQSDLSAVEANVEGCLNS